MTDRHEASHWLDAMHLASASLPVGGFAYSQALEHACEAKVITDVMSAERWIHDYLMLVLARQELPWWMAAHRAASACQWDELGEITRTMMSLRETAEFRLESKQMAHAMVSLYERWLSHLPVWPLIPAPTKTLLGQDYGAAHAALCGMRQIPISVGLMAWIWAWLDNQILAVVKLIPLGQRDGQQLVHRLKPQVCKAVDVALKIDLTCAGSAAVGLAIHSMRHETQYARLFRS